jgi:PAS domain S-box-containing protein
MVYRQLVLVSLLLVVFWVLYARLYRQESSRWWGLAWTSFAAYLAITALLLHLAPEWTLLKSALVLFSVFARFLQVPLLVFAACSMRLVEPRWRPWLKPGIGVALLAGALSFAVSFMYRNQPVTSISLRSLPQAVGFTAALLFYAFSFLERWRRDRSSPATALVGGFCLLLAWDQVLYAAGYIRGLILGPNAVFSPPGLPVLARLGLIVDPGVLRRAFDLPLLVHPSVVFLEGFSSCGICVGMAMLVMEGHYRAKSDLKEIALRSRYLADNNAALLAEIKERKRLEQALKETEDRYRDLVEHTEDLVCTHDLKGRLLFVNPTSARVLGYQVDELLRMTLRDLLAPRYRDRFDIYISRIQRKGAARGLMTVLSRTGEERIWEYNNVLRTEGVPYPIVRGMAHDVTEKALAESDLRRSEAKFATAFRSNPSAMMISTLADGKCIDVNDAFQRQTGYGRDEVIGCNVRQLEIWVDATE